MEMRTAFGRQKALTMVEHNNFFYINLYDNRVMDNGTRSSDKIGLGLDELDEIIRLRSTLELNKDAFIEVCFYTYYI